MNSYRAADPYNALTFDFESYEMEVESGRRRIVTILLLNMLLVIINIVSSMWTLDAQTQIAERMIRAQMVLQKVPNQEVLLKQMMETLNAPTYPVYVLIGQVAIYIVIAVLPWVAVYLGKRWAKALVGFFAILFGVTAVLTAPYLAWIGFYGLSMFSLSYGLVKLYTVYVFFMVPSVTKYFNHANL